MVYKYSTRFILRFLNIRFKISYYISTRIKIYMFVCTFHICWTDLDTRLKTNTQTHALLKVTRKRKVSATQNRPISFENYLFLFYILNDHILCPTSAAAI